VEELHRCEFQELENVVNPTGDQKQEKEGKLACGPEVVPESAQDPPKAIHLASLPLPAALQSLSASPPSLSSMPFGPAPRRETIVVTQPQPPSAPHKQPPLQVESKTSPKRLCSLPMPLQLSSPLLCSSAVLRAEQMPSVGPAVC
jgi:hypothetical protein